MSKDNIFMFILLFSGISFAFYSRDVRHKMNKDYDNYIYHDMNTVRPIPDHVR